MYCKNYEKLIKNGPKINQKLTKHKSRIVQNLGLEGSGAGLDAPWAVLGDPKRLWRHLGPSWRRLGGVLEASWRGLGGLLGGLGPRKVANMAPTWPPKRSQNQLKIDAKIEQFFSGSWNRFLEGFWWILDAKMKQS